VNLIKSALVVFSALFIITTNLYAQNTGKIVGTVVDAETGETLIGVNVVIEGTIQGTATDIDGNYTIRNVSAGTYDIIVSYLSFSTQTITGLVVAEGETKRLDITMQPESEFLDEIVVTAEAVLNNEAGLLRQRQKSIAFSDAISSESISSSGSSDAAGALKKVVGASVVDGKYIFIRGLGDRYTSTHLNGSELPSSDPNRKSFQLDIFPSNLIDNITTLKTFTPDKPGNFSGGLVDITTKDFPESLSFQLTGSTGFNTQSTFNDLLIGDPSNTDFLGFDGGRRDVPQEVLDFIKEGGTLPTLRNAKNSPTDQATLDRLSKAFNDEFRPREQYASLNQSYSISIGNLIPVFGKDFGYTASLSYGQNYSGFDDGISSRYDLVGNFDTSELLFRRLDVQDIKGQRTNDLGGMITLAYKFDPNHKITARYLRTQNGTAEGRYLEGFQYDIPDGLFQTRVIKYTERSLSTAQLNGKSYFENALNTTVEWRLSSATNTQDEPDLRYFTTQVDTFFSGAILYSNPTNNFDRPGRYYRELEESNNTAGLDITIPLQLLGRSGNVKFGGNINIINREFRERRFDFFTDDVNFSLNSVGGDVEAFFDSLGVIGFRNNGGVRFGNYVQNATTERSNYDATKDIYAGYIMAELPVMEKLKLIGGFRLEQADIEVVSLDSSQAIGSLSNVDLLPSISAVYSINEKMNVRAAYTQTLARPTFRELAPYITFDFVGGLLFRGNANLERTLITNYDLRWEYFTGTGEIIAVSGFYKDMENPLERVIRTDLGNDAFSIQNVESAQVYGFELEIRKNLYFLSETFRHFSLATNYTFVRSRVDIPQLELDQIRNAQPDADDKRDLQGQSPFLFNFDLGYDNPDLGLKSSLSYNLFGDRLSIITEGATPDNYERGYGSLNFTANKSLTSNFELSLKMSNLLDPDIIVSQKFKGEEYFSNKFKNGRTFSLGIKYKL